MTRYNNIVNMREINMDYKNLREEQYQKMATVLALYKSMSYSSQSRSMSFQSHFSGDGESCDCQYWGKSL